MLPSLCLRLDGVFAFIEKNADGFYKEKNADGFYNFYKEKNADGFYN